MCTIWIRKSTTVNYKIIALSPGDNLWDTLPTHRASEILSGVAEHSYVSRHNFYVWKTSRYSRTEMAKEKKSCEKAGTWK